jgi:UDP-GlcNAc:undecaprenyl-phosphate GlcNAc-1-phosphate transferase
MSENQIIYGLISFPLLMILVILIAKKFDLFDRPNNRKIHKTEIVNISGIAIYIYLIFIVASSEFSNLIEQIIVTGSVATIIGFIDDRKELKPTTKLFLLLFPSGYLIFNGFILTDLGSYKHINIIELGNFPLSLLF